MNQNTVPLVNVLQKDSPEMQLQNRPRHMIQVYHLDTALADPVVASYAISCPDTHSAALMYELVEKQIKILTYIPKDEPNI